MSSEHLTTLRELALREVSRFRLSDGSSVNIEVDADDHVGPGYRDVGGTYEASQSLHSATRVLGVAITDILQGVIHAPMRPDEVELEFSVRVHPENGLTIVDGRGEGHFRISAMWRPSPSSSY